MSWIAYNNRQYPRQNWPELLQLLENEGEWQLDVSRFIQSWLSGEDVFSVQTSGSTGVPKTLQLSRAALEASAKATALAFNIPPGAHALCCLPVHFIAGKMMVVRAMVNSWNLILTRPDAEALRGVEMPIDFAAMTPYQVEQSMVRFPNRFQSIGKLIIGGAATSPALERKLDDFPVQAWATYGMTETITHVAARELGKRESNDVFLALHGIEFSVTETAALRIHAEHLPNGVITTNDMVELISATQFKLLGRLDDVINSGGIKLHPERIERKLDGILHRRYYIAAQPDSTFGQRPCLVIEGRPLDATIESALIDASVARLEKYEIPAGIRYMETFECTPTGKVKRILP